MKTRKALAVLLALVMLVVPLVVSSYAATAASIVTNADVIAYTDTEYFNPQGLVINDGTTDVIYTPANKDFNFVPALNEPLSAETTEINVFYKNVFCGTIAITVTHTLTGKLEHIGNGHGEYCLGCGKLFNFAPHTTSIDGGNVNLEFNPDFFDPEFIIPNDDGGFLLPQTQTGTCGVCGGKETINIPQSEGFLAIFGGEMTELEATIVGYIYQIAVSLIQMLVNVK